METLFDIEEFEKWREHWKNMPEYKQEDLTPFQSVIVHFESREDMDRFAKLIGQKLTYKTKSVWYPEAEIGHMMDKLFVDDTYKEPIKISVPEDFKPENIVTSPVDIDKIEEQIIIKPLIGNEEKLSDPVSTEDRCLFCKSTAAHDENRFINRVLKEIKICNLCSLSETADLIKKYPLYDA